MATKVTITKSIRNFPRHTLEETLVLPQKIQDEMAGKPFKRLLLADALGIKPSSSNFRDLLSSSYKYTLTEGTEKASEISLTQIGVDATQDKDNAKRINAIRKAIFAPSVFRQFYTDYADRKLPSTEMMKKLLVSEYTVGPEYAEECARVILENGKYAGTVRDIGGSLHVIVENRSIDIHTNGQRNESVGLDASEEPIPSIPSVPSKAEDLPNVPRPIFVGHGKKKTPLEKLLKFLDSFKIPYRVVVAEANLGRPISKKVKDTMLQCGSAILIFTRDERFQSEGGDEVWRPSENVVHELGASSYAYEDRVVIFKEKGLHFPANYESVGHIEFEGDSIEAKTADLLKELIGFGLVKITT